MPILVMMNQLDLHSLFAYLLQTFHSIPASTPSQIRPLFVSTKTTNRPLIRGVLIN